MEGQFPFLAYPGDVDIPIPMTSIGVPVDPEVSKIGKIVLPDGTLIDPDDYPAYLRTRGEESTG